MRARVFKRFVLILAALAIGLSGCAGAYRDTPIMTEDLIVDEIVRSYMALWP